MDDPRLRAGTLLGDYRLDQFLTESSSTITWLAGGRATATFAGMVPKNISVSTVGGVTTFRFEDKVYFYASDRATAAAQLDALR